MTPLGAKLRDLRRQRGVTMKHMADAIGVSPAYLSALEHGRRGTPTFDLIQRFISYFNIIWDDADELNRLVQISNPRVVVDTAGLSPQATEVANLLARTISSLNSEEITHIAAILKAPARKPRFGR
ncbi:MAG: helix-turn-helix transcriptional regulator [Methylobacteriaceae bacterium]|nr:helix-turn-helix transcriptional regulator [Methylobacteriaceae bacterium]MBV9218154.1 helix-turn-helix transcriptional regulator [Methylobacteriaceae bacterium]MBV9247155.1 helix-turn-helix transcriptional regulator [Methylobacteriaceae bacterium]MBV9633792.1 helix-turn-helix transcriptional regulator [Methylobacteriaceae bacterium]MBV9701703.1 helix-turn-helix transcriptional regulator [Methylobacteriaceae bacterium]